MLPLQHAPYRQRRDCCRGIYSTRFLLASAAQVWIRMHLKLCVRRIGGDFWGEQSPMTTGRMKFPHRSFILYAGILCVSSLFSIGLTITARKRNILIGSPRAFWQPDATTCFTAGLGIVCAPFR